LIAFIGWQKHFIKTFAKGYNEARKTTNKKKPTLLKSRLDKPNYEYRKI